MNTNELSAQYICEDDERLRMALHVYKAMPAVRKHLIKAIFKAAGERVAEKIEGVELWYPETESEHGVYFYTEETGDFYVFAQLEDRKRRGLPLYAGVYADAKSIKTPRDKVRERFGTEADLGTWAYGGSVSPDEHVAYAYVQHEHKEDRWDTDDFLSRAILNRDEIVSHIAELLVRIYEGTFVP